MRCAIVAVDTKAYSADKRYTYLLPDGLQAQPGSRVLVPFGRGNRQVQGLILELADCADPAGLKEVLSVTDPDPLIDRNLLEVISFLKEHTFCTYFDAVRAVLPAGCRVKLQEFYQLTHETEDPFLRALDGASTELELSPEDTRKVRAALREGHLKKVGRTSKEVGDLTVKMAELAVSSEEVQLYLARAGSLRAKHEKVLDILLPGGPVAVNELCYLAGVTPGVIKTLEKRGLIELRYETFYRTPHLEKRGDGIPEQIDYTPDQRRAIEGLSALFNTGKPEAAMLHGVTGSGKTMVYIALCDQVVASGKQVLMLLPEIALTPQFIDRFYQRYGDTVAVLHSSLSTGERYDEWKRIHSGEVAIVIGTRSAIFAPVQRLGLIVIDEEQEQTYKSESSPKYHARDVAKFRAAQSNALLVLGSATPDIETYYNAARGRYHKFELPGRFNQQRLPSITVADLREDLEEGSTSSIGVTLAREIKKNLRAGEQTILFLNRRGHHTHMGCSKCGHVCKCKNCSVSMTYHSANHRLMCHYCGYSEEFSEVCPECGSRNVKSLGFGTQKAEEDLRALFPEARILRMDTDTTSGKNAHERLLSAFRSGKYDILIGTQMIAKGLDISNVTLVGVLFADGMLYLDDFRSQERTYGMLTQVAGRAGRGEKAGRAIIQTYTPESKVIRSALRSDYKSFIAEELAYRRAMLFPPYCSLYRFGCSALTMGEAMAAAQFLSDRLIALFQEENLQNIIMFPPAPAPIERMGGNYRARVLIKCMDTHAVRDIYRTVLEEFYKNKLLKQVAVSIDRNPVSML